MTSTSLAGNKNPVTRLHCCYYITRYSHLQLGVSGLHIAVRNSSIPSLSITDKNIASFHLYSLVTSVLINCSSQKSSSLTIRYIKHSSLVTTSLCTDRHIFMAPFMSNTMSSQFSKPFESSIALKAISRATCPLDRDISSIFEVGKC